MADYAKLIDAEIWDFIRRVEAHYPPDAATRSIAEQRAIYDAMCRAFASARPPAVSSTDKAADLVPVRHYQRVASRETALVLYFHGGGFVVGGLESHDDICAEICAETGFDVVSVDYRLCPEHPHPAAHEDSLTAYDRVRASLAGPIVLVGDSAGGTLAASVAGARRGDARLAGQVLIYPGLGGDPEGASCLAHARAPMLTLAELEFYREMRSGGRDFAGDASFAPLCDRDFAGLPPTLALGAECDPLADDATSYARAIGLAGGEAVGIVEKGLVHGHLRARHCSKRAAASFARVLAAIRALAAGAGLSGLS